MANKLKTGYYIINRLKHFLPRDSLKVTLLYAHPQQSKLNKLVTLQKKVIHFLNKCKYNAHTNNLFYNMNILKLNEIYDLQVDTYNTRNRNNPIVPMHRTESGKKCIAHIGPIIWIKVPDNIKKTKTVKSFRSLMKKSLLKRYLS